MADDVQFKIESPDLQRLTKAMNDAANHIVGEVDATLLVIGGKTVEEAKRIAADNGSQSIPGSVHGIPGKGVFAIRAGGSEAPIGSLWELGNKGSRATATTFDHPVFGRYPRVPQDKHPFLRPARIRTMRETRPLLNDAWRRAFEPYGVRVDVV